MTTRLHLARPEHRAVLTGLLAFMAVWCELGMAYALGGAPGVPERWLEGSPFGSYVVPGLILGAGVGGSVAAAAFAVHRRRRHDDLIAAAAALVLVIWILEETLMIGLVSALQPIVLVYACVVFVLAARLAEISSP